jgi:hypothetical protein
MKKEKYLHAKNRGICKPCATEYERNQQLLRKANKNPNDYLTCNSCDRIFSNRNVGNYSGNNQYIQWDIKKFQLRVDCPFCKSEDIDRF